MDLEWLFKVLNTAVLPAWFLLMAFPRAGVTRKMVRSKLYPLVFAACYAVFLIWGMLFSTGEGGMQSMEGLRVAFESDVMLLAAWTHYLVFDLFVGIYMVNKNDDGRIPHWAMVPLLLLTLFFGPIGWGCFEWVRRFVK